MQLEPSDSRIVFYTLSLYSTAAVSFRLVSFRRRTFLPSLAVHRKPSSPLPIDRLFETQIKFSIGASLDDLTRGLAL
ncbi:hypothetical protein OPV22_029370 [Ensete ventricosum]|uniref:Uncharacterized protein n=1 Tax=Ensete ventricosum TaxID=4639 RepID=A0AAV8QAZ7_ENSVE|nr:hypothetical protein OPV22_029370 [Ensete ventricosum]